MNYDLIKGTDIKIRTKKLFRALFKQIHYAGRKLSNLHSQTIFLQNSLKYSLTPKLKKKNDKPLVIPCQFIQKNWTGYGQ